MNTQSIWVRLAESHVCMAKIPDDSFEGKQPTKMIQSNELVACVMND